jgi:hypothetical protein
VFDEIARHLGNFAGVGGARQTNGREFRHQRLR